MQNKTIITVGNYHRLFKEVFLECMSKDEIFIDEFKNLDTDQIITADDKLAHKNEI
jgi:hypothetical protein